METRRPVNSDVGHLLMTIVKQVVGHHVSLGGEQHSGWLPQGAAMPRPTPTNDVALNITIESDGAGYNLCWVSSDRTVAGDLWYQELGTPNKRRLKTSALLTINGKLSRESLVASAMPNKSLHASRGSVFLKMLY